MDYPPDCTRVTRPTPAVGDISSKTLWIPERIYRVLSSRRHHGERDQRTRSRCRDSNSLRAAHPSIKARGVKMGSGTLHVRRTFPPKVTILNNQIIALSTIYPSSFLRADFADNEQTEGLLAWTHPHLGQPSAAPSVVVFTEAENAAMLRLPRKECKCIIILLSEMMTIISFFTTIDLASPQETHNLYLTLLTFLFAYAYDARTTQHDPTPESAWTIAALTPAFSALDPPPYPSHHHSLQRARGGDFDFDFDSAAPDELAETLIPSYRRAIAFPLYRSWVLADACRADVAHFLLRGTRTVLRCLLELRVILDAHEVYYVYSRIWLDDFCRWIQACARYVISRRLY